MATAITRAGKVTVERQESATTARAVEETEASRGTVGTRGEEETSSRRMETTSGTKTRDSSRKGSATSITAMDSSTTSTRGIRTRRCTRDREAKEVASSSRTGWEATTEVAGCSEVAAWEVERPTRCVDSVAGA